MQLPSLLQQNLSIRMRAPLLAPSLVLIALQSKQPGVLKEALKWYDRGLSYLRTRLKHLNNDVPDDAEDNFLICAALFMSIYETLHTTVVGGYEQHVIGAVALLQARGPELFAKPEHHDLFLAIRGHAVRRIQSYHHCLEVQKDYAVIIYTKHPTDSRFSDDGQTNMPC